MKLATSKYIAFLDADDTLDPQIVDLALYKMEKVGADILTFGFKNLVNGKNEQGMFSYFMDLSGYAGLVELLQVHNLAATARLYKTSLLRDNGLEFPEHLFHEDIVFTIKAFYFTKKATYLPIQGYNWIQRCGSITSEIREKHISSMLSQLKTLEAFLREIGLYEKLLQNYVIFCWRMANILFQRIRAMEDVDNYNRLLIRFLDFIEELDLDRQEYITIGNAYKPNFATDILKGLFSQKEFSNAMPEYKPAVPQFPKDDFTLDLN